jgi:hypothetical protein
MSPRWMTPLGLGIALIGCARPQYVFVPVPHATASVSGEPASLYRVPPQSPEGDVEVATFGIQRPAHGPRSIHVRMIVSNDSAGVWTVDTRRQLVALPGVGRIRAMWAYSSVSQPPRISIGPSQEAVLDLFYPLPPRELHARDIPDFDVLWDVQTDRGPIGDRTRFNRYRVEPVIPYSHYEPYGWYDDDFYGPWWDDFDDDFDDE